MLVRRIKERFKRLQRGRMRWAVAVVGSLHQSIKYLSPIYTYPDQDGDWYNIRENITLVSSELNVDSWEQVETRVLDLWCHDYLPQVGDTVIDLGAGIGDDSLAFSRLVGESGRVIAIEAHPHTFRSLVKTIHANGLKNIIAVNAAVSDLEGFIYISNEENFLSNSTQIGQGGIPVKSRTLESIIKETGFERVDLIKMNIEGAETSALIGMKQVLDTTPHVVVSCHDFKANRGEGEAFRTYDDVFKILAASNYNLRNRPRDPRPEVPFYLYAKK